MDLLEKREKQLSIRENRSVARQFRAAILADNIELIKSLCSDYNPHYVHAAFKETIEYPGEINVVRYVEEMLGNNGPLRNRSSSYQIIAITLG